MLATTQPDLADFELHKVVYELDFDSVRVPGACAAFYRRAEGARTLSVGIYMMDGLELFRAWGYTDEEHCSFHLVTRSDATVDGPHPGCPQVRVERDGDLVTGVTVSTCQGRHRYPVTYGEAVARVS